MRLGFALEYSLGHRTHSENLKAVLANDTSVRPYYVDLPYDDRTAPWAKLPGIRSNWSLRASVGAYLGLRPQRNSLDACLFHTQVTSLLSTGLMHRIPSVISLDATPLQYDALGVFYNHAPSGSRRIEALKKRLNERAFSAAEHLVTWSHWAKASLTADYGVPGEKITVIPPGIDTARFCFSRPERTGGPIQLLFVGGDFERKGGDLLLKAIQQIPSSLGFHAHVVTKSDTIGTVPANVTVYRGIAPNSPELLSLFQQADLFVFPTRGDCLPLAVLEALAAGLPVITTDVGALSEAVTHGRTGMVIPLDDVSALTAAIISLAESPALRRQMSEAAREDALERFSATTNYRRLVDVVKGVAT